MVQEFTETTLPAAVRWLPEANNYAVEGPVKVNGSEVDLIATLRTGLSVQKLYIEVTIQYVDTAKYGKDLTKLSQFRNEPNAERLIVSSRGFTPDVIERAPASGVMTLTYDQLFSRFEQTETYISAVRTDESLASLEAVYEEPVFEEVQGTATEYLTTWLSSNDPKSRWLVVVGEYGTGKTALMRILQYRWTAAYQNGSGTRLPLLVRLRDFARQFDARGLLHKFADENGLGHIPIEFLEAMISDGRTVLLLDGYDEMAQYLNARERRACLEALAELARGGARGILTSRPNYFTEAEELRVFEVLYNAVSSRSALLGTDFLRQELAVDQLIESFILDRKEQRLIDLTPDQTKLLVQRHLADDLEGSRIVLGLLDRVFHADADSEIRSLAGKPVIVTYLLEVVEELKRHESSEDLQSGSTEGLSEWQIFALIVRNLMRRDYQRTQNLAMEERLAFLQELALELTRTERKVISEDDLRTLVLGHFRVLITRRTAAGEEGPAEAIFEDIRSSSTLTRGRLGKGYGWTFSHNSLREFLVVQLVLEHYLDDKPLVHWLPMTDPMIGFASSCPQTLFDSLIVKLGRDWAPANDVRALSQVLTLLWPGMLQRSGGKPKRTLLQSVVGAGLGLNGTPLRDLDFSGTPSERVDLSRLVASNAEVSDVNFSWVDLNDAEFVGAGIDSCEFASADLSSASFKNCILLDCDLTNTTFKGADFTGLDFESTSYYRLGDEVVLLEGSDLVGYLAFHGASTDKVPAYNLYQWNKGFPVILKIARNLIDVTWGQRRGLQQRGESRKDVGLATKFVDFLLSEGLATTRGNNSNLVGLTNPGRSILTRLLDGREISEPLATFVQSELHGL